MRRWLIGALMMILLVLTGCGGAGGETGEELALKIRTDWLSMTGLSCHVDLTADYGRRVFDCGVDVTYDKVSGGTVTVTEPDLIAGLTARLGGDSFTLTYDGVSLETGPVTDEGISPLEAIPTFYEQLTTGYLAVCGLTEETLELTFRDSGREPGAGLETVLTFDRAACAPLTGRLYWNGRQVLSAAVRDFTMMTGAGSGA